MPTISIEVVRSFDGSVDMTASLSAAKTAIEKFIADKESEDTAINVAVHEVFDQFKGANINMPALVSLVVQKLGGSPENFKVLGDKIANFVRDNSGEFGTFTISKGRGGGVRRNSDKE
jgi:hypothetical protein